MTSLHKRLSSLARSRTTHEANAPTGKPFFAADVIGREIVLAVVKQDLQSRRQERHHIVFKILNNEHNEHTAKRGRHTISSSPSKLAMIASGVSGSCHVWLPTPK